MAQGSGSRWRRARVLLAIVGVVAAAAILGGGLLVGTGGLGFLIEPTPEILYVTYPPGPTATPHASDSADSTASATASPDASPTGSPGASPTAALTYGPPGPTPTPALANLKFIVAGASHLFCGEAGGAGAMVTNDGPVATTSTAVLSLTDTYDGHEAYWVAATIPILAAGAIREFEFPITLNSGCGRDHVMVFRIDPTNSLPESYKLDNVSTYPHYVGPAGPNLFVSEITIDPATPECSVGFDVRVTVANRGGLSAPASKLRVVDLYGATELIPAKIVDVPALAVGSHAHVTVNLTVQSHCLHEFHTIKAAADYNGLIDETHEDDNTGWYAYHVGEA